MVFSRLGLKLSVLSSLLVLAVIGAMANWLLDATRDAFLTEMRLRAETFSRASREAVFPKVDPFALHFTLQELMNEPGVVYAEVLDADGKVLSHSDPARVGDKDTTREAKSALGSQAVLLQKWKSPEGIEYFDYAAPIRLRAKRVGTVRLGFTQASMDQALERPKRQILVTAAVAVAAAVIGTALLMGWMMRPLPVLAAAFRQIGRGKLDTRIEWKSNDEIGEMAKSFNEMALLNQLSFQAMREANEWLESVFSEARDGLVLTDTSGRFLLVNPTARRLLGFGDSSFTYPGGQPRGVKEAFLPFEIEPKLEGLFEDMRRTIPFELKRKAPKLLILSGSRDRLDTTRGPSGMLWAFRDTTTEKREEVLSRSVLSLISHKMRTPLMACMGYLDILSKDPPQLEDFHKQAFDAMLAQHQRLSSMVEKLLVFASVYSPDMLVLDRKPVAVKDVVQGALRLFDEYLQKSGANVLVDEASIAKAPAVLVDGHRVQEAVRNLMENAVKFNPKKERTIEIRAAAESGSVRIAVLDNGPGIPEEEHPKLFRKFYQVEEGFTGQIEGMGLGLAFVKNIAEAHGGSVGVRSGVGRGSEFYILLPAAPVEAAQPKAA